MYCWNICKYYLNYFENQFLWIIRIFVVEIIVNNILYTIFLLDVEYWPDFRDYKNAAVKLRSCSRDDLEKGILTSNGTRRKVGMICVKILIYNMNNVIWKFWIKLYINTMKYQVWNIKYNLAYLLVCTPPSHIQATPWLLAVDWKGK